MRKSHLYLIAGILLMGAVFRFVQLGRASYQIDEINVVRDSVQQPGMGAIFKTELERFTVLHRLPFLMMVLRVANKSMAWTTPLPPEWLSRLPFALLGLLTLPLFYLLGKTVWNRAAGFWCLFLCAFSVYHTYYSREAYDYSMVIFLTTGVLWTGAELLRWGREPHRVPWKFTLLYVVFSTFFLQAHLSALLFLAPFNALLILAVLMQGGGRRVFAGSRPTYWLLTLGAAYAVFLPFLLKLFTGGFVITESDIVRRFSMAVFPALLGRMGWGEAPWSLIPFSLLFIAGLIAAFRTQQTAQKGMLILLVAQLIAYFAIQSWMLRVSRFEVRYYSPIFPLLILFAAIGLEWSIAWVARRFPAVKPAWAGAVVAGVLLLWLVPSLIAVVRLNCRGYSYKTIAEWINTHVPEGGVYAHPVIFELRGVPNAYPTPGRVATYITANSTAEDNRRNPTDRAALSLFTRFPQLYLVETMPNDDFVRAGGQVPIPRDDLFYRHELYQDPAWDLLVRLKTFPPGEVQLNLDNLDSVLYSYNKPEDLPLLAARRGFSYYHSFGPEWQYVKEYVPQRGVNNDWMSLQGAGILYLGAVSGREERVKLRLHALAQPSDLALKLYGADGGLLAKGVPVRTGIQDVEIPGVLLKPGLNALRLDASSPNPGYASRLFVYAIEIESDPGP